MGGEGSICPQKLIDLGEEGNFVPPALEFSEDILNLI